MVQAVGIKVFQQEKGFEKSIVCGLKIGMENLDVMFESSQNRMQRLPITSIKAFAV